MLKKKNISVKEAFLKSCDENDIEYEQGTDKRKKDSIIFVDDNKKEFLLTKELEIKEKKRGKKRNLDSADNSLFTCALNSMKMFVKDSAVR